MMKRLLLVVLAISAAACSSDNPTGPSISSPTTLTYTPTVQGPGYVIQDVTVTQNNAQVVATLRWTDSSKDLDLFWTNALCLVGDGGFVGTGCQVLFQSDAIAGTSEQVTGPGQAGSTIRLFVVNFSDGAEAATLTVVSTP